MSPNALRDLLNRLRWSPAAGGGGVVLTVRTRADGEDRCAPLSFADVSDIQLTGLTVADGTFLPYHRILEVRREGEVLWKRRSKGKDDEA